MSAELNDDEYAEWVKQCLAPVVLNPGDTYTVSPVVSWGSGASDPLGDIKRAMDRIKQASGYASNQIIYNNTANANSGHIARVATKHEVKHGTLSTYNNHGCRCDECKDASRLAKRKYRQRFKGVPSVSSGDTVRAYRAD